MRHKNNYPRLVFALHAGAILTPLFLSLALSNSFCTALAQDNQSPVAPARIAWSKQPGVSHYRLQVATDSQFNDVIFDRRITGIGYVLEDLPPGRYYWRVAPAETQTGEFLRAVPFEVRGERRMASKPEPPSSSITVEETSARTRRTVPGWSAATGDVAKLIPGQLREGFAPDFLVVNADGTVYALQGTRGIALWTAPFYLDGSGANRVRNHSQQFTPMLVNIGSRRAVVVAFDQGMRALDGSTGREIWNTRTTGRPVIGTVLERQGANPVIAVAGEKANKLTLIDAPTGQLINQLTLRDEILQPPVLISQEELLVPLRGGLLEVRSFQDKYVRSTRVATEITTPLQLVSTPRGRIVLLGLRNGLVAFDASSLQGMGRIAIDEHDYPVGALSVVDLNGDRVAEVVMSTNAGRVIAVNVSDGKIRWSTEPGYPAVSPSFADLDGDAWPDVILAGSKEFAVGLSGLNGGLIWRSVDASTSTIKALAVAKLADGRLVIVGSDRSTSGLRALEVSRASAKMNQ